jgi:hypothetical protein
VLERCGDFGFRMLLYSMAMRVSLGFWTLFKGNSFPRKCLSEQLEGRKTRMTVQKIDTFMRYDSKVTMQPTRGVEGSRTILWDISSAWKGRRQLQQLQLCFLKRCFERSGRRILTETRTQSLGLDGSFCSGR